MTTVNGYKLKMFRLIDTKTEERLIEYTNEKQAEDSDVVQRAFVDNEDEVNDSFDYFDKSSSSTNKTSTPTNSNTTNSTSSTSKASKEE